MHQPALHYLNCPDAEKGHRMAYWLWGDVRARHTIVCVHGLSRQGRDFDVLAQALLARGGDSVRVICPDVAGRGQSDWLQNPALYNVLQYAGDMLALLQQLAIQSLDWVGTSMGGLIGMAVAAHAPTMGMAVPKLVLNDVGPVIQWDSIQRIGAYLGQNMQFANLQQAADAMWAVSTSFGPHTPAQWLELSRHMVKPVGDGTEAVRLHYDPAIAIPFRAMTQADAAQGEALAWKTYDAIQSQTLLVRGAESDLLARDTALQMTHRGPKARLVEFAGVGHAPTFIAQDQIDTVLDFLLPLSGTQPFTAV